MEPFELIAQAIGIVAMAFNILSYQQKTRKMAISFQLVGSSLFALSFLMLDAIVGGILNFIGVIRAIVYINKEKLRADRPIWLIGFVAMYVASYVLTFTVFQKELTAFNCIVEALPVIGMTATNISFGLTDAKDIRKYGLISSPAWLIYNIVNVSIGAICCEVLSLCSIVIGMLRLDRDKQPGRP